MCEKKNLISIHPNPSVLKQFQNLLVNQNLSTKSNSVNWINKVVESIYKKSYHIPKYINDFRIPLFLREKEDTGKNLSGKAQIIHLEFLLRTWYKILNEEKSLEQIILTQDPEIYIEKYPEKYKIHLEPKGENKKFEGIHELINKACEGGKGLFTCSNCSSTEYVITTTEQRARCDEGMTIVNRCGQCHKTWHIN